MKRCTTGLIAAALALCVGACEMHRNAAELASDRSRGIEFFGRPNAMLGWVVNGAGDLNGDGFDDFALVAYSEGVVYLIFGRSAAAWESSSFNLSAAPDPAAASWIRISGGSSLGTNGIASGDFNGDGIDDLLLSSASGGKAYCIFGRNKDSTPWSASFNVETSAFVISSGTSATFAGNAGDMNGDGIEDMLVVSSGSAFVVFGTAGSNRSTFDLGTLDGTNGFSFSDGSAAFGNGNVMGSVGDVNGDGLADLAIGDYTANSNRGRAFILFARNVSASGQQPWSARLNATTFLDGTNGFVVDGPTVSSFFGYTATGAGDLNGDGFADILIGPASTNTGAWIVFGHQAPWTTPLNVSQLDGANGFHFTCLIEGWGYSGGSCGDFNGDGFDDVVMGGHFARNLSDVETGAAAVLFGRSGTWPAELDRTDAVGSVGFLIFGSEDGARFGFSSRGAGDVNGDGVADLIMSAYLSNFNAGYALLVFGVADDHCAVCSNTTDECIVCDDGFFLNGTVCEANQTSASSSPSVWSADSSIASFASFPFSSSKSLSSVVVIETGNSGLNVGALAAEVAQLLGVDVGQISVVEITPGTFEVTVVNEEVAQQLVDLVEKCMDEQE